MGLFFLFCGPSQYCRNYGLGFPFPFSYIRGDCGHDPRSRRRTSARLGDKPLYGVMHKCANLDRSLPELVALKILFVNFQTFFLIYCINSIFVFSLASERFFLLWNQHLFLLHECYCCRLFYEGTDKSEPSMVGKHRGIYGLGVHFEFWLLRLWPP